MDAQAMLFAGRKRVLGLVCASGAWRSDVVARTPTGPSHKHLATSTGAAQGIRGSEKS
jgi:hypothetical protein